MDSWALKAIEREADNRAFERLAQAEGFTVAGLGTKEILALRNFYQRSTGRRAEHILLERRSGEDRRVNPPGFFRPAWERHMRRAGRRVTDCKVYYNDFIHPVDKALSDAYKAADDERTKKADDERVKELLAEIKPYTIPGAVTRLEIGTMVEILSLLCSAYYELKARR